MLITGVVYLCMHTSTCICVITGRLNCFVLNVGVVTGMYLCCRHVIVNSVLYLDGFRITLKTLRLVPYGRVSWELVRDHNSGGGDTIIRYYWCALTENLATARPDKSTIRAYDIFQLFVAW